MSALKSAESKFEIALNHFNYAENDYIDEAIKELNVALDELNLVRKELGLPLQEI